MSIIAINGRIGSGKDTVGTVIQYLTSNYYKSGITYQKYLTDISIRNDYPEFHKWQVKKFADKLKDIVCILIGCTREQLEDQDFKNSELGEEWKKYYLTRGKVKNFEQGRDGFYWNNNNKYFNNKKEAEDKLSFLLKNLKEHSPEWWEIKSEILTPRLLLQLLGTECGRDVIHPSIWVNALMSEYNPTNLDENGLITAVNDYGIKVSVKPNPILFPEELIYPSWIITDMRFPNEYDAVKAREGITIGVKRPCFECNEIYQHKMSCSKSFQSEHPSENALDNHKLDYEIINDKGIPELIEKVKQILLTEKII
jgi:hypothetical protein